jgi:transposase
MERLQAFKFELRPDGQQERQMRRFAGSCRFVFNKALALQKARYAQGEKKLGYAGLCRLLTEWRNSPDTAWLADAPVHPLQQTLKDLERAYSNFFAKRANFPRFKKKGQHDAFRYPDPKQIKLDQIHDRILLPKLRWLVAVPPHNTSRTCPCCGHVSADNRKTQAQFRCVGCGFEENADVVGAINILGAGHARFACEVSGAVRPPGAGTHRSDSGAAPCRA